MTPTAEQVLALLAEHGARLHALLLRLTLRADVAEDLMQELFCSLARSDGMGRADDPLAYAFRAATNLAFAYRRRERRRPDAGGSIDGVPVAAGGMSPLSTLIEREDLERVLDAVGQLAEQDREIVILRYLERTDFAEIAARIQRTPHQTRALCHKAVVRLRKMLSDDVPAPAVKAEEV